MPTWNTCFSNERLGSDQTHNPERTDYERDWDRLIFSSAFRRLQNKTQVFPLPEEVFVHNRLTHSLEVASVGRSLGQMVGEWIASTNEVKSNAHAVDFYRHHLKSVVASACLAHDLGNPAFGHSGEEAISKFFIDKTDDTDFRNLFTDEEWADLVSFEGNANALRILTRQFNGRMKGGFGLTISTLGAIIKYPCPAIARDKKAGIHRKKYGFFQTERDTIKYIADRLEMIPDDSSPLIWKRHPFVYLVEAADDICYTIIDVEDAHRLNIITTDEAVDLLIEVIRTDPNAKMDRVNQVLSDLAEDKNEMIGYLRAKAISSLTNAAAQVFIQHADQILNGSFNVSLLDKAEAFESTLQRIQKISVERIYNHHSVIKIELAGFRVMSGLIEDLVEAALTPAESRNTRQRKTLHLLPAQYRFEESISPYEKVMHMIDYVSGMTDIYALKLYKNLRGIEVPVI